MNLFIQGDRFGQKHERLSATCPEWRAGQTSRHQPRTVTMADVKVIAELKESGALSRTRRCRPSPYLNNMIAQAIA